MQEIRQTESNGTIIGVLSEMDLKIEETEVEVVSNGNTSKKKCNHVVGAFSIETDNGTFKFFAPRFANELKKDGTKNKSYDSWVTVINEYTSKMDVAKNGGEASRVKLSVGFNSYDKFDDKTNNVVHNCGFTSSFMSRVSEEVESSTDVQIEGVIKNIRPEMKNDEESGRLLVDFITVGYGDKEVGQIANVDTFVVEEDIADAFVNGYFDEILGENIRGYQAGDTCVLNCEVKMTHVGGDTKPSGGLGRKAKVKTGYDKMEIIVFGGEKPYNLDEEANKDKIYSVETVKGLLNERQIYIDSLPSKAKAKANGNSGSSAKPSGGLGNRKPNVDVGNAQENPFL